MLKVYIVKEVVEFYLEYLSNEEAISLPNKVNTDSKGKSVSNPSLLPYKAQEQACLFLQYNACEVEPYIELHNKEMKTTNLKRGKNEEWLKDEHNRTFK